MTDISELLLSDGERLLVLDLNVFTIRCKLDFSPFLYINSFILIGP